MRARAPLSSRFPHHTENIPASHSTQRTFLATFHLSPGPHKRKSTALRSNNTLACPHFETEERRKQNAPEGVRTEVITRKKGGRIPRAASELCEDGLPDLGFLLHSLYRSGGRG